VTVETPGRVRAITPIDVGDRKTESLGVMTEDPVPEKVTSTDIGRGATKRRSTTILPTHRTRRQDLTVVGAPIHRGQILKGTGSGKRTVVGALQPSSELFGLCTSFSRKPSTTGHTDCRIEIKLIQLQLAGKSEKPTRGSPSR